ncbi:oxidoreductase [Nakamurella sp. YIM 132087]|uniref:Oxidoreductase n=1 Tax=Nakamurella alba TaxID=2665158 RepID=A0A7K1FW64_9ACTN|nr:oxidoreductase [Nakamurella alba]MTD17044.1 oxidoreductase [Nakamurella alba]
MPDRPGPADPLLLPGVADAAGRATTAARALHRHPTNQRGFAKTAAVATVRAARASAGLDGGSMVLPGGPDLADAGVVDDPVLAGALRVGAALPESVETWSRAPLQVLARLHTLAAADLPGAELGRPRVSEPGIGARLAAVADLVVRRPWDPIVLVAVVHGELLTLRPFGTADGVVARAAARLTMMSTGLDPRGLTVPEVGHLRAGAAYASAAAGYAEGTAAGLAGWMIAVAEAVELGAREGRTIADAAAG